MAHPIFMVIIQEEKPLQGEYTVPYEKPIVDVVEALIRFARTKGYSQIVSSEGHWEVIEKIFEAWAALYPEEYQTFKKTQSVQKSHQKNKHASSREGEAILQHIAEIPLKFEQMIKVIFPMQRTQDKKFIRKLARRMNLLKMPDSKL